MPESAEPESSSESAELGPEEEAEGEEEISEEGEELAEGAEDELEGEGELAAEGEQPADVAASAASEGQPVGAGSRVRRCFRYRSAWRSRRPHLHFA